MLPGIFIQLQASRGTFRSRTPSIPHCNCYVTQKLARACSSSPGVVIVRTSWSLEFTRNDLISLPVPIKRSTSHFRVCHRRSLLDHRLQSPAYFLVLLLTTAGLSTRCCGFPRRHSGVSGNLSYDNG